MSRAGAKLAVFDVDGTLVDSRAVIHDAAVMAFGEMGLERPSYDQVRQIVGLSLGEAMARLAPQLSALDAAELVRRYQGAFQRMRREPGFSEPLYPGAAELLVALSDQGWVLSMATGKSRQGVEHIVRMHGWDGLFASTHCADDGPGKPHPAMLLAAVEAGRARLQDVVMIGDTSHDMAMAINAGVRAQGVSWGFHTPAEIAAAGADHIADDFEALHAALAAFREEAQQDARAHV